MYSIRKWLYKPKKEDTSILAQFFYADEELHMVATELDSFDGRKDPERCTALVNQLRQCQDKVLSICNQIMDVVIPNQRANRDFRVKFPDDVLQETLAGQLWFGAECLAAGSNILNREVESSTMRPLAKQLTKTLDNLRSMMREQCLRNPHIYSDKIKEAMIEFDQLFAEFELSYVSAMVPVKTMKEYDMQQDLVVLFSETAQKALELGLISQEALDDYDPALMFTIPRLAIVSGLLMYPDGPFKVDGDPSDISEMFRPFRSLMLKIRDLLWTLSQCELLALEKALCNVEDSGLSWDLPNDDYQEGGGGGYPLPNVDDYVQKVCQDYTSCKHFISNMVSFVSPRGPSPSTLGDENVASRPEYELISGLNNARANTVPFRSLQDGGDMQMYEEYHTAMEDAGTHVCDGGRCSCVCGINEDEHRSLPVDKFPKDGCGGTGGGVGGVYSPSHSSTPTRRLRDAALSRQVFLHELSHFSPPHFNFANSPSNWDSNSYYSTDTSSYNSDCQDDEEIALAMQAAEIASRRGIRARFKDSQELVHRLFVCISGVADQLQTSNASDLRNILKCVFEMNCSQPVETPSTPTTCSSFPEMVEERVSIESAEEASERAVHMQEEAPAWVPDVMAPHCMACQTPFNLVRRRHHCRNCGKVFCGRCSSNFVPLPRYGLTKPVRVCSSCLRFQGTPFVIPVSNEA